MKANNNDKDASKIPDDSWEFKDYEDTSGDTYDDSDGTADANRSMSDDSASLFGNSDGSFGSGFVNMPFGGGFVGLGNDIFTTLNYSNWDTAHADMLSDIEGLFRVCRLINNVVDDYTLGMFHAGVDSAELERQVQVLSRLLRKTSARVNVMCENNIKSLESQLDIIRQKDSGGSKEEDEDFGLL